MNLHRFLSSTSFLILVLIYLPQSLARHIEHHKHSHQLQLPTWRELQEGKTKFWRRLLGDPYDMFVSSFNNNSLRNEEITKMQDKFEIAVDSMNDAFNNQSIGGWLKSGVKSVGGAMKTGMRKFMQGARSVFNIEFNPTEQLFSFIQKGKIRIMGLLGFKGSGVKAENQKMVLKSSSITQGIQSKSKDKEDKVVSISHLGFQY